MTKMNENQKSTDSRLKPGHEKRMAAHTKRIQLALQDPKNQDDGSHSEDKKAASRKRSQAREDAKKSESEKNEMTSYEKILNEIGSVGLKKIIHKRERTVGDPLSVGRKTTQYGASKGYRTEGEKNQNALLLKQRKNKGLLGGGASGKIKIRRLGIAESKESNIYERIFSVITEEKRRSNAQLDYILKSKKNVMSGATRTLRRGLRKAKSGNANDGEDLVNNVPKNFPAMMRRGRRERVKGRRKKFVASAKKSTLG